MTKTEAFVESMNPRNSKERKKLVKIISQVSVRNEGDYITLNVPPIAFSNVPLQIWSL